MKMIFWSKIYSFALFVSATLTAAVKELIILL